jgi:hypothetical protein
LRATERVTAHAAQHGAEPDDAYATEHAAKPAVRPEAGPAPPAPGPLGVHAVSEEGFIRLSRRAFLHFLWREPREKTRWEAWIDLIQAAAYAPDKVLVEGRRLGIGRGEVVASLRFLGVRWGWDKNRVARFLKLLRQEGMVETRNETGVNILKLCKYEQYNPGRDAGGTATQTMPGQRRDSGGTPMGQGRDSDGTNRRKKERKEGQERDEVSPPQPRAILPTLDQAMEFAPAAGVSPEAAEAWWLECDARPLTPSGHFTDKTGQPIARWQSHLTAYGRKWQANDDAQRQPGRRRAVAAPSRALQPKHEPGDEKL